MTESRLLYSATMSLDGCIAGVGGDMSWLTAHLDGPGPDVERLMSSIGALLVGRRTYSGDDPNAGTDHEGAFGGQWQGPAVVLTHDAPPGEPPRDITFSDDLGAAVALAKAAASGRYVNVLGADVARQCIEAGLLDEVLVYVAPVLLGDGVRLFDHPGGSEVALEAMGPDEVDPALLGPTGMWFRVR
jgi:dihydrofolate reductase